MKLSFAVLLLCLSTAFGRAQTTSLSLRQAQNYAVANSYGSQLSMLEIEQARKRVNETIAIGLPQVNGSLGYQNFIKQGVTLIPASFTGGPEGEFAELVFGTKQNTTAEITATQLIFNGSYLVGLQSVKAYLQLSKEQKFKNDVEVRDAVSQAYYAALIAKENALVLRKSLKTTEKILGETVELVKSGFAEEQDADQVELLYSTLENNVRNAERQTILAYDLLKFQMGMPVADAITLSDQLDSLTVRNLDPDFLELPLNINRHIDMKLANTSLALMTLSLKNERSKYLPSANAFLTHQKNAYRDEFNFLNKDEKWFPTTLLGVSLNIPIFSSMLRKNTIQRAALEVDKAAITKNMVKERIAFEAKSAKANYSFALDNYTTEKKNLDLAERILQKTTVKYTEGISSSFELTQADSQYQQTQGKYIGALYQLLTAKSKLDKALNKY